MVQRRFIEAQRTAVLATVDVEGRPRLVPICFALSPPEAEATVIWSPLDEKPKTASDPHDLARVRDIERRPDVRLLFEHWDEDWTRLGWLRIAGVATVRDAEGPPSESHTAAIGSLRRRYPQYLTQALEARPVIEIRVTRASGWSAGTGVLR